MRKTKVKAKPRTTGAHFDVSVPEKRETNFFTRIKKSNEQWVKAQAKAKGLNQSEYVDLLIDGLRSQREAHA